MFFALTLCERVLMPSLHLVNIDLLISDKLYTNDLLPCPLSLSLSLTQLKGT